LQVSSFIAAEYRQYLGYVWTIAMLVLLQTKWINWQHWVSDRPSMRGQFVSCCWSVMSSPTTSSPPLSFAPLHSLAPRTIS